MGELIQNEENLARVNRKRDRIRVTDSQGRKVFNGSLAAWEIYRRSHRLPPSASCTVERWTQLYTQGELDRINANRRFAGAGSTIKLPDITMADIRDGAKP